MEGWPPPPEGPGEHTRPQTSPGSWWVNSAEVFFAFTVTGLPALLVPCDHQDGPGEGTGLPVCRGCPPWDPHALERPLGSWGPSVCGDDLLMAQKLHLELGRNHTQFPVSPLPEPPQSPDVVSQAQGGVRPVRRDGEPRAWARLPLPWRQAAGLLAAPQALREAGQPCTSPLPLPASRTSVLVGERGLSPSRPTGQFSPDALAPLAPIFSSSRSVNLGT